MGSVAKLLIQQDDQYLMMYRSDHPTFGVDPDLPGGTVEEGESPLQAVLREVWEEVGINFNANQVSEIFSGNRYSSHGTHYTLFVTEVSRKPEIIMSWEHSRYEWMSRSEFIKRALGAKDTYMHMVGDVLLARESSTPS